MTEFGTLSAGCGAARNPLATSKEDLQRLFWMLSLAITIPTVLLSGPFAGYLISQWLIRKWHFSSNLTLILMLVGLAGSMLQTVRLLKLLYKGSKNKTP